MATTDNLKYKTDGKVVVSNFHYTDDDGTDILIDDGVGSITIVNKKTGEVVVDGDDIPLTPIVGTPGSYRASVPWSLALERREKYTAQVTLHGVASDVHYYGEKDFPIVVDS